MQARIYIYHVGCVCVCGQAQSNNKMDPTTVEHLCYPSPFLLVHFHFIHCVLKHFIREYLTLYFCALNHTNKFAFFSPPSSTAIFRTLTIGFCHNFVLFFFVSRIRFNHHYENDSKRMDDDGNKSHHFCVMPFCFN